MSSRSKIKIFLLIVFALAGASATFSQSVFQSWNEVQLIVPLVRSKDSDGKNINRVTATFSGIARFGRKDVELVDGRTGVMLDFRVNKHLSFLSGVLYRKDELTKNAPHNETRLDLGVNFSTTLNKFSIRDRNLFERRFRNGRADTSLYRNRLQISHPIKRDGKVLFSPFISEEVYYDITNSAWVQNEFYAGISRSLNKRTVLDIAYIRNDSKPVNVNGLSLSLKITLR